MVSFDVFDTIITRTTDSPLGVFEIMEDTLKCDETYCLIDRYIRENFASIRVAAEINASRFFNEKNQVTFDDIYSVFQSMTGCEKKIIDEMKQLELATEEKCSVPINENINKIKELHISGENVILISDMYLGADQIRKLLIKHDAVFVDFKIYSSADYDATKHSGILFKQVKEIENVLYRDWLHIGDNKYSDVLIPCQLGISVDDWYKKIKCTKNCSQKEDSDDLIKKVQCHFEKKLTTGPLQTALFGGLLLYGYVEWIINIAENKDIKLLCFIARDGFILKRIADIIIESKGLSIDTEYIYGSRVSWNPTKTEEIASLKGYIKSVVSIDDSNVAFIDMQATGNSFKSMCRSCGIKPYYFCFIMLNRGTRNNDKWYVYSDIKGNESYLEVLCRAPHGVTKGYFIKDGKWEPIIDDNYQIMDSQNQYLEYIEGIVEVCKYLTKIETVKLFKYRKVSIEMILDCPTPEIMGFVGEIYHDGNNETYKFAPAINAEQAIKFVCGEEEYRGCFFEYSLKRMSADEKKKYYGIRDIPMCDKKMQIPIINSKLKIIIYGAGRKGKQLVHSLKNEKNYELVAWVDLDYISKQEEGLPVISLQDAIKKKYDYVIISIMSGKDAIKDFLVDCGVVKDKILIDISEIGKV